MNPEHLLCCSSISGAYDPMATQPRPSPNLLSCTILGTCLPNRKMHSLSKCTSNTCFQLKRQTPLRLRGRYYVDIISCRVFRWWQVEFGISKKGLCWCLVIMTSQERSNGYKNEQKKHDEEAHSVYHSANQYPFFIFLKESTYNYSKNMLKTILNSFKPWLVEPFILTGYIIPYTISKELGCCKKST